ncbi:MAG: hypothetical protein JXO72_05295 [Vicinamibacteria bacterium]|nr:hypothetical protein [Vicinamibacteria bacterium]
MISERAKSALEPLIAPHCEILPLIELRRRQYYAVNVLTVIDCVDHARSDICYAQGDPLRVTNVFGLRFHVQRIPSNVPIFKVPIGNFRDVLVTHPFVDAVIANGLRGAAFADPAADPFRAIMQGKSQNVVPGVPE